MLTVCGARSVVLPQIPYHAEIYQGSGYPAFLAQQAQRGAAYAAGAGEGSISGGSTPVFQLRDWLGAAASVCSATSLLRCHWPLACSGGSFVPAGATRRDLPPRRACRARPGQPEGPPAEQRLAG